MNGINQNKISEQQKQEPGQEQEKVELTKEQYDALLNKVDELEAGVGSDDDDLDTLAQEAQQQAGRQQPQAVDYDNMTNQQLVVALQQDMDANVVSPLRIAVETLGIKLEISELTKQEGYKDFWEHQEVIGPIAKANPNLSLKQCYDLAVGHKPKPEDEIDPKLTSTREQVLRHLPDPKKVHSEKPGAPASTVEEGDPQDLKGAAGKAYDEVFGEKK